MRPSFVGSFFARQVVGSWPMKRNKNVSNDNDHFHVMIFFPRFHWPSDLEITLYK